MHCGRVIAFMALCLAACTAASGQLPAVPGLAMPAIVERATPPEAVEMWRRSEINVHVLTKYLPGPGPRRPSAQIGSSDDLQFGLEHMAVRRLGDIAGVGYIPRLQQYAADREAAREFDAATTARLAIERIRARARGRDAYIREMIRWVQTPFPPRDPEAERREESPPGKSIFRRYMDVVWRVVEGARALAVIHATEAIPVLLAKREELNWRDSAEGTYLLRALARFGDPRSLETTRRELVHGASSFGSRFGAVPLEPGEPDVAWSYWQVRTRGMTIEQTIDQLVRSLADPAESGLRADGILLAIGRPAMPALVAALSAPPQGRDPEWAQISAVRVLGKLREREAVAPLLGVLRGGPDRLRGWAAYALGEIGDSAALDDLIAAAQSQQKDLQGWAIWALRQIGDARATSVLLALARDSADPNIRYHAVDGLGDLAPSSSLPALQDLLTRETSESVRYRIKAAIEKVKAR